MTVNAAFKTSLSSNKLRFPTVNFQINKNISYKSQAYTNQYSNKLS